MRGSGAATETLPSVISSRVVAYPRACARSEVGAQLRLRRDRVGRLALERHGEVAREPLLVARREQRLAHAGGVQRMAPAHAAERRDRPLPGDPPDEERDRGLGRRRIEHGEVHVLAGRLVEAQHVRQRGLAQAQRQRRELAELPEPRADRVPVTGGPGEQPVPSAGRAAGAGWMTRAPCSSDSRAADSAGSSSVKHSSTRIARASTPSPAPLSSSTAPPALLRALPTPHRPKSRVPRTASVSPPTRTTAEQSRVRGARTPLQLSTPGTPAGVESAASCTPGSAQRQRTAAREKVGAWRTRPPATP